MKQLHLAFEVAPTALCPDLKPATDDAMLAQHAQAGDAEALECLFCQHWPAFCHHAEHACSGDLNAAEDVCQDACIKAFLKLSCLAAANNFYGWVCGFIDNKARHWRRNLKKVGTRSEEIGTYIIENMSARADTASAEEINALLDLLRGLADQMPGPCGLTAHFMIEQYQHQEDFPSVRAIAQVTHDSHGSAQRHRRSVLQAWRKALERIDASSSQARRRPASTSPMHHRIKL